MGGLSVLMSTTLSLKKKLAYEVSHSFEFHPSCHTTWCSRFFYAAFIRLRQKPDGVIWMTENPEVISADIR